MMPSGPRTRPTLRTSNTRASKTQNRHDATDSSASTDMRPDQARPGCRHPQGTIVDDDELEIGFAQNEYQGAEAASPADSRVEFRVELYNEDGDLTAAGAEVRANFITKALRRPDGAAEGSDFVPQTSGELVIPTGEEFGVITVEVPRRRCVRGRRVLPGGTARTAPECQPRRPPGTRLDHRRRGAAHTDGRRRLRIRGRSGELRCDPERQGQPGRDRQAVRHGLAALGVEPRR